MTSTTSMLRKPKKGKAPDSDLHVGNPEEVGHGIAHCLKVKGYCVLTNSVKQDITEKALADVKRLDKERKMKQPASLIQEALLGPEGSNMIFELPLEKDLPEDDKAPHGDGLAEVDKVMWALAKFMKPFQRELGLGFEVSSRSMGVVHSSGSTTEDNEPTDQEVALWMSILVRQKVAVFSFLGPGSGTLELRPYDEEAMETEITTEPGMVILIRSDLLQYKFFPQGHRTTYAVGCSFLQDSILTLHGEAQRKHWTPVMHELAEWTEKRLMDLKQQYSADETALDERIPRNFVSAMNHNYFDRAQTAVRGLSSRQPSTWDDLELFKAMIAGPDLVTEVPISRWDHSTSYDPDPECWKQWPPKTNCKHGAFMDGVDLFDAKFFGLSAAEVKIMDPNQRQVLEVCYDALYRGGLRKKDLLGSTCGVYVGTAMSDWNMAERQVDQGVFGATGGAPSITAGRVSFTLGLKGACTAIDTDAASSLTCTYHACESVAKKGLGVVQDMACALGVHAILARMWWPAHSAAGFLAPIGRCCTFDASAQGWVRADNCSCIVVKSYFEVVDGEPVKDDSQPLDGIISGAGMNNNGVTAGLTAPNGPAEQEVMYQMTRMAGITTMDVDGIECHGAAQLLSDAVEASSIHKVLRANANSEESLLFTSMKSNLGNGIEGAGLTSLIKTMHSLKWGVVPPNQHLRQLNPYIPNEDCGTLVNECLGYRLSSAFVGTSAKGMGGTNVAILCFGQVDEECRPPPKELPDEKKPQLFFWPAGGGSLGSSTRPKKGYSIIGTFNRWAEAVPMESEGEGCYSYMLTLGENRWEAFQIRMDNNAMLVLHPNCYAAPKGSAVHGPSSSDEAKDSWWLLNARSEMVREHFGNELEDDDQLVEYGTPDKGRAGDRYRISLHIAGKYRTVNWAKVANDSESIPCAIMPSTADYFVTASWNGWELEQMMPDPVAPGRFKLEVTLKRPGGEFRLVRNKDSHQTIYPLGLHQSADARIVGPQDPINAGSWLLEGPIGSRRIIEFSRVTENGVDMMKLSWH